MVSNGIAANSPGITIRDLSKAYGAVKVMHDVNLDIPAGSFVALLGPSGCGKTTLLRMIAGLIEPSTGQIRVGDTTVVDVKNNVLVPPQRRNLGMVFQHYALWPHMTVRQNITYPLRKKSVPKASWPERVQAVMEAVGLPTILDRRPAQLSGGQQQRVALARALVSNPNVLLLDEPLSNLDANLREQLRRELRQLHDRQGTTTILVTHDQEEAAMLADVVVVMKQGRIVQIGDPNEIIDHPVNRFVATFVGYDNFIPATHKPGPDGSRLHLADGQQIAMGAAVRPLAGEAVLIACKSGQLELIAPDAPAPPDHHLLTAIVTAILKLGRWREITLDVAGSKILLNDRARVQRKISPGESVRIALPQHTPLVAHED